MRIFRLSFPFSLALSLSFSPIVFSASKEKKPDKPAPPTRAFDAPGAPNFTRLDGKPGVNPPVDANGDFVIGPDYVAAPETKVIEGVPQGKVQQFQIDSKDCKLLPFNPETPDGAWGFYNKLIPESPAKPLRIWMAVGDRDNYNPNVMRDGMHDWVEANHRMATVLKTKGYSYQYLFCLNTGHGIGPAKPQILPHALEWLWKGYPITQN